jgi:hypothetical protein
MGPEEPVSTAVVEIKVSVVFLAVIVLVGVRFSALAGALGAQLRLLQLSIVLFPPIGSLVVANLDER